MPATTPVQSGADLLEYIEYEPARAYIQLLMDCSQGGVTVGVLDTAIQAEAVSDWEAAAILEHDLTVDDVANIRETLCRTSDLVVRHGHRKAQPTYRLHDDLINDK